MRNSSLVEWFCAENVTGLKRITEAMALSRFDVRDTKFERGKAMIRSYKDFEVYKKSYETALRLHQITLKFPKHELMEIGGQLRRAAISIPLNIAEGYGRKSSVADFKNFLRMALGSCNEVMVLLEMTKDLGYMNNAMYQELNEAYDHIARQLFRLIKNWK